MKDVLLIADIDIEEVLQLFRIVWTDKENSECTKFICLVDECFFQNIFMQLSEPHTILEATYHGDHAYNVGSIGKLRLHTS